MAGSSKKLQERFFKGIASGMDQRQAAKFAGVSMKQVNEWRDIYPEFENCIEMAVDRWHRASFTKQRAEKVLQLLRDGSFRSKAAAAVGVDLDTLLAWMIEHPDFARDVEAAEAKAELEHLRNLRDKAGDDWRASAWWLERKHPDRWGKRETLNVNISSLSDEQLEEIAAGRLDPREITKE